MGLGEVPEHTQIWGGRGCHILQANCRAAAVPCLALPAHCLRSQCSVSTCRDGCIFQAATCQLLCWENQGSNSEKPVAPEVG